MHQHVIKSTTCKEKYKKKQKASKITKVTVTMTLRGKVNWIANAFLQSAVRADSIHKMMNNIFQVKVKKKATKKKRRKEKKRNFSNEEKKIQH